MVRSDDELSWASVRERLLEGAKRLLLPAPAIVGVERTQGVQFFAHNGVGSGLGADNGIPLIAGRDTVLRVYVDLGSASIQTRQENPVTARLSCSRLVDNVPQPVAVSADPVNGPIFAQVLPFAPAFRGETDSTLNFRLPGFLCRGRLVSTLRSSYALRGRPVQISLEEVFRPTRVTLTLDFEEVADPQVWGVLFSYSGGGANLAAPGPQHLRALLDGAARMLPVRRLSPTGWQFVDWPHDLGVAQNPLVAVHAELLRLRRLSGRRDLYVGLLPGGVPQAAAGGFGGLGAAVITGGDVPTSHAQAFAELLAHEIGHAAARRHAPCGDPSGIDPNYPAVVGSPPAGILEDGFDTRAMTAVDARHTFDFMGYCQPRWTSTYTYQALRGGLQAFARRPLARLRELADDAREHLHLSFETRSDGSVSLLPSFHTGGEVPSAPDPEAAPVWVELLDAEGAVLAGVRSWLSDPLQDPDAPALRLQATLPWADRAGALRFVRGDRVEVVDIEPSPPAVSRPSVDAVEDGVAHVLLGEPDPGARPGMRMLLYSHDGGGSWRAVAPELPGPDCRVDLEGLPGGSDCRFRVLASAGVRTAFADSDSFAVEAGNAPD